jgi:hypothetical protein
MAPALADAATLRAATRLEQGIVHLLVDHSCLHVLQQQLALGQGQAESFYGDAAALEFGYLLHLLVVGIADSDQLEAELHARPAGQLGSG